MLMEEAYQELLNRAKEGNRPVLLWDVITALRGYDSWEEMVMDEADTLKDLTTARVRAISGLNVAVTRFAPLTSDEILERDILLKKVSIHFFSHFFNALKALHELGYPVPEAELEYEGRTYI